VVTDSSFNAAVMFWSHVMSASGILPDFFTFYGFLGEEYYTVGIYDTLNTSRK
jgi:hypothetical protein